MIHFKSESNEHYTPEEVLKKAYAFLGWIDLDPCADPGKRVPAHDHFTQEHDGLSREWYGKIWVNPPYGRELPKWTQKAIEEFEEGRASEILILVPSRTDTKWYHSLSPYTRLFFKGRLKFLNPGNKGNSAPFPSALFYLGDRDEEFLEFFGDSGEISKPLNRPY
jgi:hypothetical protein